EQGVEGCLGESVCSADVETGRRAGRNRELRGGRGVNDAAVERGGVGKLKRAAGDRGRAGVGVGAAQDERAGTELRQVGRVGDIACIGERAAAVGGIQGEGRSRGESGVREQRIK